MVAQRRVCVPPLSLSPNPPPNVHASSQLEHCGFSLATDSVSQHPNLAFVKAREISTMTLSMMKPTVRGNKRLHTKRLTLIVAVLGCLGAFDNEIFDIHPQGEDNDEEDDADESDDDSSTSRPVAATSQVCKCTTRSLPRRVLW